MKLTIIGDFKVKTDNNMMNNVRQPLEIFELEITPNNPVTVNRIKSKEKQKEDIKNGT